MRGKVQVSNSLISDAKLQLHMALEIILRLDIAQEHRQLSEEELQLRKKLKVRVLGLAAVERARKKQVSRITNLKLGDANTKIFHRRANARRRKNYIQRLQNGRGWAVTHDEKVAVAQTHFGEIMGRPPQRSTDLNWDTIDITQHDLRGLDTPFTEEELKKCNQPNAIRQSTGAGWIYRGLPKVVLGHHKR